MNMSNNSPKAPQPPSLNNWPHKELWIRIVRVLNNLPNYFKSNLEITFGVNAEEIYAFSQVLSKVIEEEVVRTLNNTREIWDPNKKYRNFRFIRQPQAFPDVVLMDIKTKNKLMGIELKSWYLLSKEGEPSFRYKVTSSACAPQDLLVIVPWALSNVITGVPIVFRPYIIPAKYAAEYRNYWWKHIRRTRSDTTIHSPNNVNPYPQSREKIDDEPAKDSGGNFGRLARTRIMDNWVESLKKEKLLGVEIKKWIEFFKTVTKEAY